MRESRNPFRLRASESIEMDGTFVKLFGPGVLDLLQSENNNDPLEGLHILRSAPGGGKTTLLRLFTPGPLLHLHAQRAQEDCRELWQGMKKLGAVTDDGPSLLGVLLSCEHTYATLADMDTDPAIQRRLFFALLDSRIVLAGLRAVAQLYRLEFPSQLGQLKLLITAESLVPLGLPNYCDGVALFNWASETERSICRAVDSFEGLKGCMVNGADGVSSLSWFRTSNLQIDGHAVADKLLVMLDDVHKLTSYQRAALRDNLANSRTTTGVWLAERLQALRPDELLAEGANAGREYRRILYLEEFWRKHSNAFEHLVFNIADRRATQTPGREMQDFRSCLEAALDGQDWDPMFMRAKNVISERVRSRAAGRVLFKEWIAEREAMEGTPRQLAIAWRALEILIERELRRNQTTFDFSLGSEELEAKEDNNLQTAAELFLAEEYKVPFYFGPTTLAKLASANIEQFLAVAGDEFEDLIASRILRPGEPLAIEPLRQQEIIQKGSREAWKQIPIKVPFGQEVFRLLTGIAEFARAYTYQPTAPNDPGVNGTAITMADRDLLMDAEHLRRHPHHARLARVLAETLAFNLLHAEQNYKCKGKLFMVLNLNRLLCVQYSLPLDYGKFKERKLEELVSWLERRPQQANLIPA